MPSDALRGSSSRTIVKDGIEDQQMDTDRMQAKHKQLYRAKYQDRMVQTPIRTAEGSRLSHSLKTFDTIEKEKVPFLCDDKVAIALEWCLPCMRINSVRPLDLPPFTCFISAEVGDIRDTGFSACAYCIINKTASTCTAKANADKPGYVNDAREKEKRSQRAADKGSRGDFVLKKEFKAGIDGIRSETMISIKDQVKKEFDEKEKEERAKRGERQHEEIVIDDDDDDDENLPSGSSAVGMFLPPSSFSTFQR